jgi:hypothetical protein
MSFRVYVSGVAVECDTPKEAIALANELKPGPSPRYEPRLVPPIREVPTAREPKEAGSEVPETTPVADDVTRYV